MPNKKLVPKSARTMQSSAELIGPKDANWRSLGENTFYLFVGKTLYTQSYINYVKSQINTF